MRLLTYEKVEKKVLDRVEKKATIFGQDLGVDGEFCTDFNGNDGEPPVYKIPPSLVAELYCTWIMPLTKEVQVQYLLQRLD
jgi:chorismate mutase